MFTYIDTICLGNVIFVGTCNFLNKNGTVLPILEVSVCLVFLCVFFSVQLQAISNDCFSPKMCHFCCCNFSMGKVGRYVLSIPELNGAEIVPFAS